MLLTSFPRAVPRFSGRIRTPEQLDPIRPLIAQIPALGADVAQSLDPALCSYMKANTLKPSLFELPGLAWEALVDWARSNRARKKIQAQKPNQPVITLQWVRFKEKLSETLDLSSPCQGPKCPVTRDGQPASGRAKLGHDMVCWRIYE